MLGSLYIRSEVWLVFFIYPTRPFSLNSSFIRSYWNAICYCSKTWFGLATKNRTPLLNLANLLATKSKGILQFKSLRTEMSRPKAVVLTAGNGDRSLSIPDQHSTNVIPLKGLNTEANPGFRSHHWQVGCKYAGWAVRRPARWRRTPRAARLKEGLRSGT